MQDSVSHIPPPLAPGHRIRVIAPSGPFDADAFSAGVAWLEQRYEVVGRADVRDRHGYLAGTDARRSEEMTEAIADSSTVAIVAARGGYGSMRILSAVDFSPLQRRPKWLVGFSDVTALHVAWARAGVASVHGPMVAKLGARMSDSATAASEGVDPRASWVNVMEGMQVELVGKSVTQGCATGPLLGGNLAILTALLGTSFEPMVDGAVLLIEDVGERPYRVDRMLTSLALAGWWNRVAGIAVGTFTDCNPGPDGVCVEDVVTERLGGLGIPVVRDLPIGHGPFNMPVRLGVSTVLDGAMGTLVQSSLRR